MKKLLAILLMLGLLLGVCAGCGASAENGGTTTADEAERAEAIANCERILYVDCPYTVICYDQGVQAVSNRWTGFSTNGNGLFGNERMDTYINVKPAE